MRKALKMTLLLGTIAVLLALTACGVDGDYKTNEPPTISITSWEGVADEEAAADVDSLVFQQRIYWNANDLDGTIAGIAYRILDDKGLPIATPGNAVIDNIGELESVNIGGNAYVGWVVHYKDGADESIPLTSDLAKKTIWSKSQYAVVNFPANADGTPTTSISSFEVIAIDNRGAVSNIAKKSFKSVSSIPTCILSTSRGNPNGKQVGTGLYITFSMSYPPGDPFPIPGADYYQYKVGKYVYNANADTTANAVLISETSWMTTNDREIILTKNTNPGLTPDFDGIAVNAVQLTFTRITAHAYNYAGVKSNESNIEFAVKEGFHPKTVIYPQKMYAIGDNHYKDYVDSEDKENYPYIFKDGPIPVIYATRFFSDIEGRRTAVNSANLKVYAKWGFYGQYGTPPTSSSGAIIFSNSPYDTEVGRVLNETDNKDYYSEIVAFDIRFDDAPYDFYALSQDPNNTVTHDDGTQWLRVPKNSVWSIAKGLEIGNLRSGTHKLEVSAVDLQYEYDPTPAVFEFVLLDRIAPEQKKELVTIEASNFPTWSSTKVFADSVYHDVLSGFANVDFFNRSEINLITGLSINACNLAYSDLQKYKSIIYREEVAGNVFFADDYDALKLYLNNGGNIILSSAGNLKSINDGMVNRNRNMFMTFFGINFDKEAIKFLEPTPPKPYFDGAHPTTNIASLPNLPELKLYLGHRHNSVLLQRKGLYDISYFAENYAAPGDEQTKVIYTAKIKNIGQDSFSPPTQEAFDLYADARLAVGKVTPRNRCFAFGFPLSFMEKPALTQLLNQLLGN